MVSLPHGRPLARSSTYVPTTLTVRPLPFPNPNRYSALKHKGQRFSDLARQGKLEEGRLEPQPREVVVESIRLLTDGDALPRFDLGIVCGGGVWVCVCVSVVLLWLRSLRQCPVPCVEKKVNVNALKLVKGREGRQPPLHARTFHAAILGVDEYPPSLFSSGRRFFFCRILRPQPCAGHWV